MSGKRLAPVIREAQPTELRLYRVYEHQIDVIAQGTPASLMLNFSLFFLGVATSAFGTLVTIPLGNHRVFDGFLIVFLVCLIAGIVLLALWYQSHKSVKSVVAEIKAQMPVIPPPAIQEDPPEITV